MGTDGETELQAGSYCTRRATLHPINCLRDLCFGTAVHCWRDSATSIKTVFFWCKEERFYRKRTNKPAAHCLVLSWSNKSSHFLSFFLSFCFLTFFFFFFLSFDLFLFFSDSLPSVSIMRYDTVGGNVAYRCKNTTHKLTSHQPLTDR